MMKTVCVVEDSPLHQHFVVGARGSRVDVRAYAMEDFADQLQITDGAVSLSPSARKVPVQDG